jgi:hypothetical protein
MAQQKKSEELAAIPEVQEAIKKHLKNHYFNEWPKTKLPALNGLTPLQAVKNKKYRSKVVALVDTIERMQKASASGMPKIDVDKLRRMLGLPSKAK